MPDRHTLIVAFLGATLAAGLADAQEKARQYKTHERPGAAGPAFEVKEFAASDGHVLPYSLFVPAKIEDGAKLPLVLCLHGIQGATVAADKLALDDSQAKHPCIVVAPRCDPATSGWVKFSMAGFRTGSQAERRSLAEEIFELLDHLEMTLPVDPDRVYVTGQSMGGIGTWGLLAARHERFAAAAPVCGIWPSEDAPKMVTVPIWAFHGALDGRVPVRGSRDMVAALKAAGGDPKYTEYPDVNHNSWGKAYNTPELWDWMFEQRRK